MSTSKGCKIKTDSVFTSPEDIRLTCFSVISGWLIKDWCLSLKNVPKNNNNNNNLEIESHDDSIILFMEDEELTNNSDNDMKIDDDKDNVNISNNKSGMKALFGGGI